MNLTPASSRDLPSAAILTRVSESGTRLMQTAIFMRLVGGRCAQRKPDERRLATEYQPGSEFGRHAHKQVPRHPWRHEPLHRVAGHRWVLRERPEGHVLAAEHVGYGDTDVVAPDARLERGVGDGVVGEPAFHVLLVPAKILRPDVPGVEPRPPSLAGEGQRNP